MRTPKDTNILLFFRAFPCSIGRYFEWALKDLGYKVYVVGQYQGDRVPWPGDHHFPKYNFPPYLVTPEVSELPISSVLEKIKFKPHLIIQAGDTCYLSGKTPCPNVILATDPHAIDYKARLANADYFFCMQAHYLRFYDFPKQTWIPYAYEPAIHRFLNLKRTWDVVFCGLPYEKRTNVLNELAAKGYKVFNELGRIYDEYAKIYNKGLIAFNWSSQLDLPARFWEGLAMRNLVLTNRVPDLALTPFKENQDYIAFDSLEEAITKAEYYIKHKDKAKRIAYYGWKKVIETKNTYQDRVKAMMKEIYG